MPSPVRWGPAHCCVESAEATYVSSIYRCRGAPAQSCRRSLAGLACGRFKILSHGLVSDALFAVCCSPPQLNHLSTIRPSAPVRTVPSALIWAITALERSGASSADGGGLGSREPLHPPPPRAMKSLVARR